MGSVHFSPGELYGTLSEIVGCKSGLALSREDIDRFLKASDEVDDFTESRLAQAKRCIAAAEPR